MKKKKSNPGPSRRSGTGFSAGRDVLLRVTEQVVQFCLNFDIASFLSRRDDLIRPLFFFQAEVGIRDYKVTGVQTCALPISRPAPRPARRGVFVFPSAARSKRSSG